MKTKLSLSILKYIKNYLSLNLVFKYFVVSLIISYVVIICFISIIFNLELIYELWYLVSRVEILNRFSIEFKSWLFDKSLPLSKKYLN